MFLFWVACENEISMYLNNKNGGTVEVRIYVGIKQGGRRRTDYISQALYCTVR